ncbi:universal stress protein [Pedobacter sp.]|uniref:universal stress protein n=1 Tax=Pedobacter sp. TaxID=1411316 RepID=UPI003D7F800C
MKTLIVLTDFSKSAVNAAHYAAALTQQVLVSRIILFNAYEYKPVATDIPMSYSIGMEALREESHRRLEQLKMELLPLVSQHTSIDTLAREETLLYAIAALDNEFHAELIVMGITGMSGFERVVIGSNTITVAREISSPLLLVPNSVTYQRINKVVFATDLNQGARKTALELKSIINIMGAKLLILNVEKRGTAHFQTDLIAEQAMLHEVWDCEDPEYYFNNNEDIAAGIIDFIKTHDVQMLIAIPRKHGFIEGIFHRSITKKLTYHSPIPLLLLQQKD